MLALSGKFEELKGLPEGSPRELLRVTTNRDTPKVLAGTAAYLCDTADVPIGFRAYLALEHNRRHLDGISGKALTAVLPASASFLRDGDIMRLSPRNASYRVLFRVNSNHNGLLLTERCNHYCLMCSQPPRDVNDDWVMDDV